MTCNYNEYLLREINQTLAILPKTREYKELRTELKRQRQEILENTHGMEGTPWQASE